MKPALIEVTGLLRSIGMSDEEIDMLMGRFLQEEAQDYIDCMKIIEKQMDIIENFPRETSFPGEIELVY